MTLNASLDFSAADPTVQAAFLGRRATRRLFHAGHALYKFTEYPLAKPDGTVTPWWSSSEPLVPDDVGLAKTRERAAALSVAPREFARARTAVTHQWNAMTDLLEARLATPAYGFFGRCASQPFDERSAFSNVAFIGGAYQIWIPNLTRAHLRQT